MQELLDHLSAYLINLKDIVHPISFVINLIVCTLLSMLIAKFYIRYGNAVSNRGRFSANFVPLALTTMSIMVIVKPSVALSLGLVGALSIVRFRAAIKDPEELTYLFLTIAVGLATGADQPLIAIVVVLFILFFLLLNKKLTNSDGFKNEERFYVNITSDIDDLIQFESILLSHFSHVELKRVDSLEDGIDLSFICKIGNTKNIQEVRRAINALSDKTFVSIIDQPDLIV